MNRTPAAGAGATAAGAGGTAAGGAETVPLVRTVWTDRLARNPSQITRQASADLDQRRRQVDARISAVERFAV
jgi:hypothetical protein